jgi:hypothetical protein
MQLLLSKTNLSVLELEDVGLLGLYFEQMGMVYLGHGNNEHVYRFQDNIAEGQPVVEYLSWSQLQLSAEQATSFVDALMDVMEVTHEKTT